MICIVDGGYAVQYGLVSYGMDCGDEARAQFFNLILSSILRLQYVL